MKPSATQSILAGLIGTALFGWVMLSLFVLDPPGKLKDADLKTMSGKVVKVEKTKGKGGGMLDLWIAGQDVPFRAIDGPYPRSFDAGVLESLLPGSEARVSVRSADMTAPRRNLAQNQLFYPFVALDVDGKAALALEAYNQWSVDNQKVAKWFLPLMFGASLYLLIAGIRTHRTQPMAY